MTQSEPWLRGTLTDVPVVQRAVLHALELANEDLIRWCGNLDQEQFNATPFNLPSLAFQVRHIARSIDRLLTYAEKKPLVAVQLAELQTESDVDATPKELLDELALAWNSASKRIRSFPIESLEEPRIVGRKQLPTTVGGLLIHIAEHTLRHVGQAITTSKVVLAINPTARPSFDKL
jgi:uncharacterized damage-inducible protein DinB